MGRLLLGTVRWIVRNALNLALILAVVIGGEWLATKWRETAAAREHLQQLQAERPIIGSELLKSALSLEQQLRRDVAKSTSVATFQSSLGATIKGKEAERDQLKKEFPFAVKVPTSKEYKQVVVLEMELAMLEQAKAQALTLANLASDVVAGKQQIDALKLKKYQAEQQAYQNKYEQWEIRRDHPAASRVLLMRPYERLQVLASQLPALEKDVTDIQVRIDSLSFTVGLRERKLSEARATFMTGHGKLEQFMADLDSRIERDKRFLADSFVAALQEDFWPAVKSHLVVAIGILVSIIFMPIAIKLFFYYLVAPWASRQQPIRILPELSDRSDDGSQSVRLSESGVSVSLVLADEEELLLHSDYLQSSAVQAKKSNAWVLDCAFPFTSVAAGMYLITRILPYRAEPIVVSSSKDPSVEVGVIEIADGAAIVFHPHFLVGAVQRRGQPLRIRSHWRLGHLHSWLTLQFRYLVFHGPAKLIVKGCRGVRLESAGSGRLINQAATLGFTANAKYSVIRCETFVSYWRGEQELFNDKFDGDAACYIYEETPSRTGASGITGITGRGLEDLTDSVLKAFGV